MRVKEFVHSIIVNDNRMPPQPVNYHCNIDAEFISIDHALSFNEDLVKLIAHYREPILVTKQPININMENE